MNAYSMEDFLKFIDNDGIEVSFETVVTEEMQDAFLKYTGDCNPMHTSEAYPKSYDFEGRLIYGMLTASLYSTLVGVYLPGKYALFQSAEISFDKPVYIGDKLTIVGKLADVNEKFNRITLRSYIKNQHGIKVSRAKLTVGIMEEK